MYHDQMICFAVSSCAEKRDADAQVLYDHGKFEVQPLLLLHLEFSCRTDADAALNDTTHPMTELPLCHMSGSTGDSGAACLGSFRAIIVWLVLCQCDSCSANLSADSR